MSEVEFQFDVDAKGFPVIRIDSLDCIIHWLPLTKIQLEYQLCDHPGSQLDGSWYTALLEQNGRISPQEVTTGNYARIFATGLLPGEAEIVAAWHGEGWRLPTTEEWTAMYKQVSQADPVPEETLYGIKGLNPRVKRLVERLKSVLHNTSTNVKAADQMFARNGVLEWVTSQDTGQQAWGLFGQPKLESTAKTINLDWGDPYFPPEPEYERQNAAGVRLIRRAR